MALVVKPIRRRRVVGGEGPDPGPEPEPFSPDDVDELRIWQDADEISGVGDGSDFGTWENLIAASPDFTAAVDQPSWHDDVVNGRAAVRFTRTNNQAGDQMTAATNPLSGASAGTVFVVSATADASLESGHMIDELGNKDFASHYPWGDGTIYDTFGTSARKEITGVAAATIEAWHIYEVVSEPGNWTAWINGTQVFTTGTNTVQWNSDDPVKLARNMRQWGGDLGLILAYGQAVPPGDRDDIRGWLASEFAIAV